MSEENDFTEKDLPPALAMGCLLVALLLVLCLSRMLRWSCRLLAAVMPWMAVILGGALVWWYCSEDGHLLWHGLWVMRP